MCIKSFVVSLSFFCASYTKVHCHERAVVFQGNFFFLRREQEKSCIVCHSVKGDFSPPPILFPSGLLGKDVCAILAFFFSLSLFLRLSLSSMHLPYSIVTQQCYIKGATT